MKLSKERVASRFLTAVRKQFWHGTSSKYVRSILKQGLVPTFKEKQYEGERGAYISIETFGGVYVTDNFGTARSHAGNASRKTGGNPLFVGMTLETRSPSALPDEDDILPTISFAVKTGSAHDLTNGRSFWGGIFRYNNLNDSWGLKPEFHKLSDAIQKADLTKPIDIFFAKMVRNHPRLEKRYKRQKQKLDLLLAEAFRAHATYLLSLFHKEYAPHKIKETEKYMENAISRGAEIDMINLYKEEIKLWKTLPPEMKQGSFQRMVKAITKLSESIREILDPIENQHRHNARFMKPITYRGKNRIQLVVETINRKSETVQGYNSYTDIVVHYLQSPGSLNEFLNGYEKFVGGDYRTFHKGRVLRHELHKDSEWPEDLWGPQ